MALPGSSPGAGTTQSADVALPAGRPGRRTWSSWLGEYAGFAPALVLFGVFFLVPLGLIVCYSFWQTVDYNVVHHWTVDNYRYFFSVPTYVSTFWATVWVSFAAAALTLYASLERFDWNQFRAAMDLGATPGTAMWRILLPQIRPGITTAVIFVFIPILGEYLTPQLVGGAKGVMIGNLIVNFFQGAQYTRGAAAALLIAGLIVILLAIFRRSLEVEDPYGT